MSPCVPLYLPFFSRCVFLSECAYLTHHAHRNSLILRLFADILMLLFRTHYCDPVPHLPPTLREINWHHVATEIYEGQTPTHYKQCNGSGEDPTCADGILLPFDPKDHTVYMGVNMDNGKAGACQDHGNPDCNVFIARWNELSRPKAD